MRLSPPAIRKRTDAYSNALSRRIRRMWTPGLESGALHCRPRLVDPRIGRRVLALRPIRGRRDIPNWDGDDPSWIENRERVFGHVLGETGNRVLVALMVVGANVDVDSRAREHHALELADDHLVIGPAASQFVGLFDGSLDHIHPGIRAFRLEVRILVEFGVIVLDESLVQRPAVRRWVGEMIVGVNTAEDAFRVILAYRLGSGAQPERSGHLHLAE